ncbi:hypothetical protein MAR_037656 [Mya arenaria]|uniref:Uncharacterized protein n=1 Tax=Mya arenaria TaxID=6604 RepID=A0ABY7FQV9_MYAAR|nr:hypothetical protein MAR_037656 [Mya arenaria]
MLGVKTRKSFSFQEELEIMAIAASWRPPSLPPPPPPPRRDERLPPPPLRDERLLPPLPLRDVRLPPPPKLIPGGFQVIFPDPPTRSPAGDTKGDALNVNGSSSVFKGGRRNSNFLGGPIVDNSCANMEVSRCSTNSTTLKTLIRFI